jgi:hypothetical protein
MFLSKARFSERCRAAGLPCVPVIMTVDGEGSHWVEEFASDGGDRGFLPEVDLFAKPVDDKSGSGAERWLDQGGGKYQGAGGSILSGPELVEHLKVRCKELPRTPQFVVQPRVVNHPDIADLSGAVLSTIRLLTCRKEDGGFECTNAVFKMAVTEEAVVDNFHAGGIAAKVDLVSGELGRAIDLGFEPGHGWCEVHPVTGVQIQGRKLPMWPEVLELGRRAHETFPEATLVGWDVALLAEGPVLLEAQASSDLDFVQRTHEQGLGESRCGELLAYHVERAIQARNQKDAS